MSPTEYHMAPVPIPHAKSAIVSSLVGYMTSLVPMLRDTNEGDATPVGGKSKKLLVPLFIVRLPPATASPPEMLVAPPISIPKFLTFKDTALFSENIEKVSSFAWILFSKIDDITLG